MWGLTLFYYGSRVTEFVWSKLEKRAVFIKFAPQLLDLRRKSGSEAFCLGKNCAASPLFAPQV